ncbi:hypothetical protein BX666DRAFT_1034589 [Dichotomocladium elegans]|nr:hypothetical protein BX666DRAFT_1034589 [Dichotomocladium elegans]
MSWTIVASEGVSESVEMRVLRFLFGEKQQPAVLKYRFFSPFFLFFRTLHKRDVGPSQFYFHQANAQGDQVTCRHCSGCHCSTSRLEALRRATAQQLERIERANPHFIPESNELWLQHCLSFANIRDAYHNGEYRDPAMWRSLYQKRFQEGERKRQIIRNKIKKEYSKIQSEKAARSIKVLKAGPVPAPNRRSASMIEAASECMCLIQGLWSTFP